jgi:DNA-binding GntR family transcriptional regulator
VPTAIPIFQKIMIDIREQIADGRLKPGDRLPTMAILKITYECSDNPVKKAIGLLEHEGVLIGHPGRAVTVASSSAAAPTPPLDTGGQAPRNAISNPTEPS